jgi:hypothetical protein
VGVVITVADGVWIGVSVGGAVTAESGVPVTIVSVADGKGEGLTVGVSGAGVFSVVSVADGEGEGLTVGVSAAGVFSVGDRGTIVMIGVTSEALLSGVSVGGVISIHALGVSKGVFCANGVVTSPIRLAYVVPGAANPTKRHPTTKTNHVLRKTTIFILLL